MPDYPHHADTIAMMGVPKKPYTGPGDEQAPDSNPNKDERPDEHNDQEDMRADARAKV